MAMTCSAVLVFGSFSKAGLFFGSSIGVKLRGLRRCFFLALSVIVGASVGARFCCVKGAAGAWCATM